MLLTVVSFASIITSFPYHAVPVPSVSITMSSDNPLYAGSSLTITCITELSASIDTDVIVSALWKKAGDSISSGDRITISQPQLVSSSVYESELTISPLSTTLDSGDYSCEISVHPSPVSPYIAASASASATVSLVVEGNASRVIRSNILIPELMQSFPSFDVQFHHFLLMSLLWIQVV